MLTSRGWALAGGGLAMVGLWWAFGDGELFLAGSFLLLAAVVGLAKVRWKEPRLRVGRRLGSAEVHSGDVTLITLVLENLGASVLRNLMLTDEVEGLGSATFELSRLRPGGPVAARYRVTCRPRGVYPVGPARFTVTDPLGLAEASGQAGPVDRLVVYPRIEELSGFPLGRGQDPALSASNPEHAHHGGEDFYTLRQYQLGDDLRRVHWPSAAKTDELMIRQLETPWQSRALVILDIRSSVYESGEAFETAVSGAASVVTHLVAAGFAADLWTGAADPLDAGKYRVAMERLAVVDPVAAVNLTAVAGQIRKKGGGGTLAIVTGVVDRQVLGAHQILAPNYPTTVVLGVSSTIPQTLAGLHRLGVPTVIIAPGDDWATPWMATMRTSWTGASVG